MKLKKLCSCCKVELTTKNVKNIGRLNDYGIDAIYYNCLGCDSTGMLLGKTGREFMESKRKAA